MSLFNKQNLRVADFASKTGLREVLKGVFFSPKETVATDSRMMLVVSAPNAKPEDYPIKAGKDKCRK